MEQRTTTNSLEEIIGWAGVDGIHYCTIRGLGETIFAVSPSNLPGDYVHPIARTFEELLGLLMSCGSMDAIEQAHLWDKVQFEEYLKENLPTEEYTAVLNTIKEKYPVTAIDDPFSYIKGLQSEFDYSLIKFSPEYYDVDMNPAAEPEPEEWKVTFNCSFRWNKGRAGKEVPVKKTFFWGNERWYIPAVYICSKGLVVDFCTDADPDELKAYITKWDLLNESNNRYSKEQQEQMQNEHPLNAEFDPHVTLNGKELQRKHGIGVSWIPASCLNDEFQTETEASPDIPGRDFMLRDYNEGDRPRLKNPRPNEFAPVAFASVGIIGGADGPTMILLSNGNSAKTHVACSSVYFEQPQDIEWYMSFNVKTMDDIAVELI